ncbi:hypothetical protein NCS56_01319900 [Fusarium sp. Ph1]|nr:hypothetical protein NCS56_01319900 [Fusarium sp. Ph1]
MQPERAVATTASLAHMGSVLAQTMGSPPVDEICPIGLNVQPIEFQVLQPILVDTFVPANTDLVINDDLVLHITDAPVSLRTVLTETSTSVTQVTSAFSGNPFEGQFITITSTAGPGDANDGSTTITYPPKDPNGQGTVIIQVPPTTRASTPTDTEDDVEVSGLYTTVTRTVDTNGNNGPVTRTYPPTDPDGLGTIVIELASNPDATGGSRNTEFPLSSTEAYTTVTTTGGTNNSPVTRTHPPSDGRSLGTVVVEVPQVTVASSGGSTTGPQFPSTTHYTTITTTSEGSVDGTVTRTYQPTDDGDLGTVIVQVFSVEDASTTATGDNNGSSATVKNTQGPTDSPVTNVDETTAPTSQGESIQTDSPSSTDVSGDGDETDSTEAMTETGASANTDANTSTSSNGGTNTSTDGSSGPGTDMSTDTNTSVEFAETESTSLQASVEGTEPAESLSLPTSATTAEAVQSSSLPIDSESTGSGVSTGLDSPSLPTSAGSTEPAESTEAESTSLPASTENTEPAEPTEMTSIPSPASTENTEPAESTEAESTSLPASTENTEPTEPTEMTSIPSPASTDLSEPSGSTEAPSDSLESTHAPAETGTSYEPCPDSLYGNPQCCSVNGLGVVDAECDSPTETPTDPDSFSQICAATGQRARCCVLPVLGQALLCMTPVGVAN